MLPLQGYPEKLMKIKERGKINVPNIKIRRQGGSKSSPCGVLEDS